MRAWRWWTERCDRPVDPRPLAATRILLGMCLLFDLFQVLRLGIAQDIFRLGKYGGLTAFHDPHLVIHNWWGADAGLIAMGITAACAVMIISGFGARLAILLGVLAYAQLGHHFPPGDRGVDRIIRTGLLVILFSGAVGPWWRLKGKTMPGWPVDLLKFILVMIYLSAGLAKLIQQPGWVSMSAEPPLLRILADPLSGRIDPVFWNDYPWLFRMGSWATIALELSSVLIFTRWCRIWACFGIAMHVGIFATMHLGMFSLGMLSLYPVLLATPLRPASDGADAAMKRDIEE